MNKIKMIAAMFIAGILLTFVSCGDNGKSKKISIAYANWSEGIAMTNLAKAIFEDQGYDVKLLNADLAPIFTSISRKKADVFMDVWMPVTMEDYMKQYGDKLEVIGDIYDGARIGLVVPDYVTINSIEELNAEKERFSGQIVGIDAGAGIMKATDQAIKDYGLDYKLMTSSGPAMTASLKKAIKQINNLRHNCRNCQLCKEFGNTSRHHMGCFGLRFHNIHLHIYIGILSIKI